MCALSYAVSQILVRRIGSRDSTLTIGLYTIVCAGIFVVPMGWLLNAVIGLGDEAPHLAFNWFLPDLDEMPRLALLGLLGMGGYLLLSARLSGGRRQRHRALRVRLPADRRGARLLCLGGGTGLEHLGRHGPDHRQRHLHRPPRAGGRPPRPHPGADRRDTPFVPGYPPTPPQADEER